MRHPIYLLALGIAGPAWAQAAPPAGPLDTTWRATAATAIPVTRRLAGNPSEAGPFHYYYQAPAGASLSAHRHSVDMRITVRSGRKFILMGPDLEAARVQRFDAGATFVIPAGTWHVEWWETDTLEEIEGVGPMRSDRASPATPRTAP